MNTLFLALILSEFYLLLLGNNAEIKKLIGLDFNLGLAAAISLNPNANDGTYLEILFILFLIGFSYRLYEIARIEGKKACRHILFIGVPTVFAPAYSELTYVTKMAIWVGVVLLLGLRLYFSANEANRHQP